MFAYPKRRPDQCMECGDDLRPDEKHVCRHCSAQLLEKERYDAPWESYEQEDHVDDRPQLA